jgi:hypothetical protein
MRPTRPDAPAAMPPAPCPALPAPLLTETRWLLVIVGDCAPEVSGPFPDDDAVLRAARAYRAREGDEDGLFRLTVPPGGLAPPDVDAFSGAELGDAEVEDAA